MKSLLHKVSGRDWKRGVVVAPTMPARKSKLSVADAKWKAAIEFLVVGVEEMLTRPGTSEATPEDEKLMSAGEFFAGACADEGQFHQDLFKFLDDIGASPGKSISHVPNNTDGVFMNLAQFSFKPGFSVKGDTQRTCEI